MSKNTVEIKSVGVASLIIGALIFVFGLVDSSLPNDGFVLLFGIILVIIPLLAWFFSPKDR